MKEIIDCQGKSKQKISLILTRIDLRLYQISKTTFDRLL